MNILIKQIFNNAEKSKITKDILQALPEWFGMPDAVKNYIKESKDKIFFAALKCDNPIGFIYLKETGKHTVELVVIGVLSKFHRLGIGKSLFENAKLAAINEGYSFIQVKTVQFGKYKNYDKTNLFYKSLGFKEFEVIKELWDKNNPCQIYIMSLDDKN